jgi:hypothetical protein
VTTINLIAATITKKYMENLIVVIMIKNIEGKIKLFHNNYKNTSKK